VEQTRRFIGADSLAYLSLDGLLGSLGAAPESYCTACWTGEYPVPVSAREGGQSELFSLRAEED